MTTRRIVAIAAAAAVAIVLVWYGGVYRPQSKHLSAAHAAYAAELTAVQQLQSQVAMLEGLDRQAARDRARLNQLSTGIPAQPDLRDLLVQLHALATATSCELTVVNPTVGGSSTGSSSSTSSGPYQTVGLGMTASGSYNELIAFMSGLATLSRTITVSSVAINPGTNTGPMGVTITAQAYYAS